MTLEDLSRLAFRGRLEQAEAEVFCQQERITHAVFLDQFAQYIVKGYVDGCFTYMACDTAVRSMVDIMIQFREFPDYAYGVFLAFDAGEDNPHSKYLTPDQITRPLISTLLAKQPSS